MSWDQAEKNGDDWKKEEKLLDEKLRANVLEILQRADLAKFAKFKPGMKENMESMELARNFIKRTKTIVFEAPVEEEPEDPEGDQVEVKLETEV